MIYSLENFQSFRDLPRDFTDRMDRNFTKINDPDAPHRLVRNFVDATSGPVTFNLPDGNVQNGKDYYIIKIDASANAVTIVPYGTQTVEGQPSCTLGAQWAGVWFTFNAGTWYLVSFVI